MLRVCYVVANIIYALSCAHSSHGTSIPLYKHVSSGVILSHMCLQECIVSSGESFVSAGVNKILLCRSQEVLSEQGSCHVAISLQRKTTQLPGQQGREVGVDETLKMTN